MQILIDVGQWVAIVVGGLLLAAALVVGTMSWLLNHPD
jgi:hypothetical protein